MRRVNSVAAGKPRNTPIGRPVGPYVVIGYVGDNPAGLYVRIGCPSCGHEIPPQARGHISVRLKKCVKCGRLADPEVNPKSLLNDAAQ